MSALGGVVVDLQEDGVLWLINRTVFHPRGFALAYDAQTKGFMLYGDGTAEWHYAHEGEVGPDGRATTAAEAIDEQELFDAVERLFATARGGTARTP